MADGKKRALDKKLNLYLALVAAIFLSLAGRLLYLQVVQAAELATRAEQNRLRLVPVEARRGDILDRNGLVLATSKPVFVVTVPGDLPAETRQQVATRLAEILARPELTPQSILEKMQAQVRKYEPVEILSLPWGEEALAAISRLEERRDELPGVTIEERPMRYYPEGALAGHVLGYVSQISPREREQMARFRYDLNDKIGKTGVERSMEVRLAGEQEVGLRGQKGAKQVEVDASHRLVRELVSIPPAPGDNAVLTLDLRLQRVMEETMDQVIAEARAANPKAGGGAAVLLDVRTGAILAMASKPDLNPNDFADGSYEQKKGYYNDKKLQPMLNRAIQAYYPPGSTFKMITGMAGLESGKITPQTRIYDPGYYWEKPYIACWQAHGEVDFYRAFAVSCNTFFQYAADMAGVEELVRVGKEFGLGEKTGLTDLGGEINGLLPTPEWKYAVNKALLDRRYERRRAEVETRYQGLFAGAASEAERVMLQREKERELKNLDSFYRAELKQEGTWWPYDTFNMSIGQGSNSYTVLQLANYVATLANGGTRYRPYLVSRLVAPDGTVLQEFGPEVLHRVDVKPETMAEVRKGMTMVTRPGGTAYSLFKNFPPEITVGAKTGTAQTGLPGDDKDKDYHGVFVAFAPADDPQVAFAGIIEYGRHGNSSAGRVGKAVLEAYFGLDSSGQVEEILPTE